MLVFILAAVYAGYLIYDGLQIVLGIPKERAMLFNDDTLTSSLVYILATQVGTVVLWNIGFAPEFVSG